MTIAELYLDGVIRRTSFNIISRKKFNAKTLADLFAEIGAYNLPVKFVFLPTNLVMDLSYSFSSLPMSGLALASIDEIHYVCTLWGADFYHVADLDAIYAITRRKLFNREGSIAKLKIEEDIKI